MISNAARKHFTEIQPATEPSNIDWHINAINIRQFTLSNIVPLYRIESEILKKTAFTIGKCKKDLAGSQPVLKPTMQKRRF